MFKLKIITTRKLAEIETNARNQAIADLVDLLRKSNQVYLEPVTLVGCRQTITNCVFLDIAGNALTICQASDQMSDPHCIHCGSPLINTS